MRCFSFSSPARALTRAVAAAAMLLPMIALGQQAERFGDYEIHYSALPTGMLNAQVAESYDILRSRTRGMLMITILRNGEPVTGRVDVLARDVDDELTEIPARQVKDDQWVSYVGTFPVDEGDSLIFEVTVNPHEGGGPFEMAFKQTFYPGK